MSTQTVRLKMVAGRVEQQTAYDGTPVYRIDMHAVYTGSSENDSFFKATPSGNLVVYAVNAEAGKAFVEGKAYYVDITQAPDASN